MLRYHYVFYVKEPSLFNIEFPGIPYSLLMFSWFLCKILQYLTSFEIKTRHSFSFYSHCWPIEYWMIQPFLHLRNVISDFLVEQWIKSHTCQIAGDTQDFNHPWSGKISHAAKQLSLHVASTEPTCCNCWTCAPKPVLQQRSQHNDP